MSERRESPATGGAVFDRSGVYRYILTRGWSASMPRVAFVLLNPNRADACLDDPTIRRCISLARQWGFGEVEVVNLFAFRTGRPLDLRRVLDPVGPENDRYLQRACREADSVVVGWGNWGRLMDRALVVGEFLGDAPLCFGMTKCGQPRHPLYAPSSAELIPWRAVRAGALQQGEQQQEPAAMSGADRANR